MNRVHWRLIVILLLGLPCAAPGDEPATATAAQETIITSEGPLEMRNDGTEAYFVFTQNVRLIGTNLQVTCDKLEVFAEQEDDRQRGLGAVGGIRRVVASGNVVITQEGRRATAGRAEVFPQEDRILLTEAPVVSDPQGTIAGEWMEFFRGERNARVHAPRVVLRALPDLGFPRPAGTDQGVVPEEPSRADEPRPETAKDAEEPRGTPPESDDSGR